jgi:hypothetical protein
MTRLKLRPDLEAREASLCMPYIERLLFTVQHIWIFVAQFLLPVSAELAVTYICLCDGAVLTYTGRPTILHHKVLSTEDIEHAMCMKSAQSNSGIQH